MTEGIIQSRRTLIVAALAAVAGVMAAAGISRSETAGAATQTVTTLGSTTGTPNTNLCPTATTPGATAACTFVPFSSVGNAELQVPFDGTVTGFSITAGSAGGTVRLRVLRPTGDGQYTAVVSSAPATLALNANTFTTSLPVKAGDLIGLDNDSSALIFDGTGTVPLTAYFQPALADGQTGAPNQIASATRLLLSATVQATAPPTTTGAPTTPQKTFTATTPQTTFTATTPPGPSPNAPSPRLNSIDQSHASWREPSKTGRNSGPVGTTFSFRLSEAAQVHLRFDAQLAGRRVGSRCVAPTAATRARRACTRSVLRGGLNQAGNSGANHVAFRGRLPGGTMLAPGRYALLITATSAGRHSSVARLAFTILAPT
jgi:hypothetical protein